MIENNKINANDLQLGYAIPVGEYIEDEMNARGVNQTEFASLLEMDKTKLNKILRGTQRLTAEIALKIEHVWGIPAHLFLDLQTQYDIDKAKETLNMLNTSMAQRTSSAMKAC